MKCLVTGATGFIGAALCRELVRRGHELVALSRGGQRLAGGTPTVALDLARQAPPPELLAGVDVVFHLAGIAHARASRDEYARVNVDAATALARAAAAAGAGCFVFVSSVRAMGPATAAKPRTEDDCTAPADDYGRSKWRAECELREICSGGPMSLVILRPALVYGPAAKGNLRLLARGVRRGMPRPPAGGRRSMIGIDDLVALLCTIADGPPAGTHTWIAAGDESYSTREIYDILRRAGGRDDAGRGWLPPGGWRLGAALLDLLHPAGGERTHDKLFGTELYDGAAVIAATGWRPRQRLEDVAPELMSAVSS